MPTAAGVRWLLHTILPYATVSDVTHSIQASDDAVAGLISDIVVPEWFKQAIPTGWPELDLLYGGRGVKGDRASMVTMISAPSGMGKTAFCLQAATEYSRNRPEEGRGPLGIAVYNSAEEIPYQVITELEFLGLVGFENIYLTNFTDPKAMLNYVRNLIREKNCPVLLVVDSLQTMDGDCVSNTWDIVNFCKEYAKGETLTQVVRALVISQVGKDGKFSGSNKLLHAVDRYISFSIDKNGRNLMSVLKNRGGTRKTLSFKITTGGLDINTAKEVQE